MGIGEVLVLLKEDRQLLLSLFQGCAQCSLLF